MESLFSFLPSPSAAQTEAVLSLKNSKGREVLPQCLPDLLPKRGNGPGDLVTGVCLPGLCCPLGRLPYAFRTSGSHYAPTQKFILSNCAEA